MLNLIDVSHIPKKDQQFLQNVHAIEHAYQALSSSDTALRARDVAAKLMITEAQWVAASVGPLRSIALQGDGREVFKRLDTLGQVMALTRNDSCVHERHGCYREIQAQGSVGLVLGPDIDLRVFFGVWQSAWAVQDNGRLSLQFFDQAGQAIHKVFCKPQTDESAFIELVEQFAATPIWPIATPRVKPVLANHVNDPFELRQAWLALHDTHDFFAMLKNFKIQRLAAMHEVGADLAQAVDIGSIQIMLQAASEQQIPIMCFVGNPGMIQIHTGVVQKIVKINHWLNVLDPHFNVHLNLDSLDSAWVVNKPTRDGWVTSLEVFDVHQEMVVQFFGARKPGSPERVDWRALMCSLCTQALAC